MRYTFVTIVYADEIGMHQLQAQSMVRYLPPDLIAEIILVENSAMPNHWRDAVLRAYQHLAERVEFLAGKDVATIPSTGGWFSQQVLKLMASRFVATERYVILDVKNVLVFPLSRSHLEKHGRMLTFRHDYLIHPLRRYLEAAAAYFDLEPNISSFTPTTTPFVVSTDSVLRLIDYVSRREGKPFEQCFIKQHLTEFFLLMTYLTKTKQIDRLYDYSGTNYPIIWQATAEDDDLVQQAIEKTERGRLPFFSLHRKARPMLSATGRQMIAAFWHRRQLFPTTDDAMRAL